MGTATLDRTTADFKVADVGLAEWGRKEIGIAEHEMPGLMAKAKTACESAIQAKWDRRLYECRKLIDGGLKAMPGR